MLFLLCSEKYSWFLEHSTIGRVSVLNFGRSGIDGKQKQAIDQGRLGASRLFQKFRDLQLVEAAMLGSLPFMTNQQASGFRVKDKTPRILIGRGRPTPTLVEFTIDRRHLKLLIREAYHSLPQQRDAISG
jgi:hypothetical protein